MRVVFHRNGFGLTPLLTFLTPLDSTEPVEFNTLALRTVWQPNLNTIICHVDINHMRDGCLGHQGDQLLLDLDLEGPAHELIRIFKHL